MSLPGKNETIVLDGGFAGQLSQRVKKEIDGDVLWSSRYLATDPESVIETHLDFLRAGSQLIVTNTYQASIPGFMKQLGLSEKDSYELIKKAVTLAKMACDRFESECVETKKRKRRPLIVGSVGSYGASLHDGSEYTGSYIQTTSVETMNEYHRPKINALVEGGVDLLALETIPCKTEAEVLINLLKNEYPNVKAWLSFTCKDGFSTSHGEDFQSTAIHCYDLNPRQLVAVGINCTNPAYSESLFKDINKGRSENDCIPLIIYPNSGEKYIPGKGWIDRDKCRPIESYVSSWLEMGVTWIGGCCRVFASDIARISEEVQKWRDLNAI